MQIINHKNFNPRLIEFITDSDRIVANPNEYWNYINETLENPKDIWNDCFKIQNNAYVRNLVILTVFNGGSISEVELKIGYSEINELSQVLIVVYFCFSENIGLERSGKPIFSSRPFSSLCC